MKVLRICKLMLELHSENVYWRKTIRNKELREITEVEKHTLRKPSWNPQGSRERGCPTSTYKQTEIDEAKAV